MNRQQWIMFLVLLVGMLVFWGWQVRGYLRRRRLRRHMVEDGRLPARRAKTGKEPWLLTIAVAGAGIALFLAAERVGARLGLSPFWQYALGGGVLFVFAFVFIVLRSRGTRDPVVAEAGRLGRQGNFAEAVERLRGALAAEPTAERAGALGLVLFRQGRWDEAADAFRDARRIDPAQPIFVVNHANALVKAGRAAEALADIEALRKESPQESAFASMAAIALAALGRADEAAEQLRQARELAEVAATEQRVDLWSGGALMVEARNAVDAAASPRAFPVVAKDPG